jgi:hypothetical protein
MGRERDGRITGNADANEHEGTQGQKGLAESSRLGERTRQGTRDEASERCVRKAQRVALYSTAQRNTVPWF